MSSSCNTSKDCDDIFDDGVSRHCYQTASFSEEENFCDCNIWYGWAGEECDEVSVQVTYWRFSLTLTSVLSGCLILAYCFYLTPLLLKVPKNGQLKLLFIIAALFFVSAATTFVYAMLFFPAAFDPTEFRVVPVFYSPTEVTFTVVATHGVAANTLLMVALCFAQFGNMSIILSWIRVLKQTAEIFRNVISEHNVRLTHVLEVIVVLSAGLLTVVTAIGNFFFIGFCSTLVLFVTLGFYLYFTKTFIGSIRKLAFNNAVHLVKRSFSVIFVCIVLVIIGIVVGVLASLNYHEQLAVGQLNYHMIFVDLATWAILLNCGFALWYVYGRINNILESIKSMKEPVSSVPPETEDLL